MSFPLDPNAPQLKMRSHKTIETLTLIVSIIGVIITGYFAWKTFTLTQNIANDKSQIDTLTTITKQLYKQGGLLETEVEESKTENSNISQLLIANNKASKELSTAVGEIILSDSQLVHINRQLQSENDSLIKQTGLLGKTVEINNKILSRNEHDDLAQFIDASYELQTLIDTIFRVTDSMNIRADSLTMIRCINKAINFLNVGLKNYCINHNNDLFTGWSYCIESLTALKQEIKQGYPNAEEFKVHGLSQGNTNPDDHIAAGMWFEVELIEDHSRYFFKNLAYMSKTLYDVKQNYRNPDYYYHLF